MKKSHITKKALIAAGLLALVGCVAATGGVLAKYVRTEKITDQAVATAKAFYFESNYLTDKNETTYNLNAGTEVVEIELYNFENQFRVSEVTTTYTVKVESDQSNFTINNEQTATATIVADGAASVTNKIQLGNLQDGGSYKVTVTANGGYEKTLSAIFKVASSPDGFYMFVENTNDYVLLTVWTEKVSGTVTVGFPAGLIPDATDPIFKDVKNYLNGTYAAGSVTHALGEYSSRSYRFFKTAVETIGADAFTVRIGTKDAVPQNSIS